MTYKSKTDLRGRISVLEDRVKYHEERATTWRDRYNELLDDSAEAYTKLQADHKAEIERLKDNANRELNAQDDRYRELAVAVFTFYGVNAQEVVAALATQQKLDDQKLLKDNLKRVKNANKTEEAK